MGWRWPICPSCGQRRCTRCPTCLIGGDHFLRAEMFDAAPDANSGRSHAKQSSRGEATKDDGDRPVMLMCPVCGEAFKPEFYRRCQWCGHDHGDGMLVESIESDQWTDRALMVLFGLIGLVLALLTYFWIILSRPG